MKGRFNIDCEIHLKLRHLYISKSAESKPLQL